MFDLQVLADVLDETQDRVLESFEAARASRLLGEVPGAVDRWQFTHELVRRTLLDQLSLSRTVRVHRTVGHVLERTRPHELAALALHFAAAAGVGEVDRAVRYAYLAADTAAAHAAHGDAARLLERGMEAAEAAEGLDVVQRIELLTRIGSERVKAGEADTARESLGHAADLARGLGSAELFAEAVLARTSYGWAFQVDEIERVLLTEALAAEPLSAPTRARLLATRARIAAYSDQEPGEKRANVAAAVAAARIVGDPESVGAALMSALYLGAGPDDLATQASLIEELFAAAASAHRPDWEAMAWSFQASGHLALGDYERALDSERNLERVAVVSRDPFAAVALGENASRRACIEGDFAEAERIAAAQTALGARLGLSEEIMLSSSAGSYVPVWLLKGRTDELEQLLLLVPDAGEWAQVHQFWLARVRAMQGALDKADGLIGPSMPLIEVGRCWSAVADDATDTVVRLNDPARAASLLSQLEPYRAFDCVLECIQYRGAVVHHMGRLLTTCGRYDEAIEHLNEAQQRYNRLGSPPWQMLLRGDLARALRARGRPEDDALATELEQAVIADADRLGMAGATGFVALGACDHEQGIEDRLRDRRRVRS